MSNIHIFFDWTQYILFSTQRHKDTMFFVSGRYKEQLKLLQFLSHLCHRHAVVRQEHRIAVFHLRLHLNKCAAQMQRERLGSPMNVIDVVRENTPYWFLPMVVTSFEMRSPPSNLVLIWEGLPIPSALHTSARQNIISPFSFWIILSDPNSALRKFWISIL